MRTHLSKIEDYPAFLEACWQEHLKPKAKDAPTVISLFAGCGGSSLGYSMAGYRELLAVEWDSNAVETFKLAGRWSDSKLAIADRPEKDISNSISKHAVAIETGRPLGGIEGEGNI